MHKKLVVALLFVSVSLSAQDLCFTGGRWFDGKAFRARTMCTSNGVLTTKRPRGARTIELGGAWVVPPFAEAHNHNVEASNRLEGTIRAYLDAGVFYVKNPNSLPRSTPRDLVNKPDSIDATFAMGGFTATGGHPVDIVKRMIGRGSGTDADGDGAFYHLIDSPADLERKWPLFLAAKPDFVKTYLMYSEEHAQRKDDPAMESWKGLDPKVLPEIVRRAHAAGLRVSTHVETATDFHHAVAAGVDEINHMPGFRPEKNQVASYRAERFRIADADAKRAARDGVVVVTTIGATLALKEPVIRETLVHNLQTLRRHKVKLAIGSDDYRNGVLPEIAELRALGIFTNRELLDLWTRATAKAIFPHRNVGCVNAGCEASFLALEGNPLVDFANTARIRMRVKDGVPLGW
jgi:hypothetical protein